MVLPTIPFFASHTPQKQKARSELLRREDIEPAPGEVDPQTMRHEAVARSTTYAEQPAAATGLSPDQRQIYDEVVTWVLVNANGLGIAAASDAAILPTGTLATTPAPLLFIHGGPGTGKSYLVSTIHDALRVRFGRQIVRFVHDGHCPITERARARSKINENETMRQSFTDFTSYAGILPLCFFSSPD